jgi:hypothetical protein
LLLLQDPPLELVFGHEVSAYSFLSFELLGTGVLRRKEGSLIARGLPMNEEGLLVGDVVQLDVEI